MQLYWRLRFNVHRESRTGKN